jgi:hypothetical protein
MIMTEDHLLLRNFIEHLVIDEFLVNYLIHMFYILICQMLKKIDKELQITIIFHG